MGVKDYANACEMVMKDTDAEEFKNGFQALRNTMLSYGFAKEAVDSLDFQASEYTLTISEDERNGGAFHTQADGKPFYVITVSAPGSMFEMTGDTTAPTALPARQQAILLAVELGMNLLSGMGNVLNAHFGFEDKTHQRAGGVSGPVMECSYETTMRCDPETYCEVLNQFLDVRLNMLAPKRQKPAVKPTKPPRP